MEAQGAALFSTFIMSLASAACVEMGLVEDPTTRAKRLNLAAARSHIELLAMLSEKTKGNLDPTEKELLQRIVTDLRLQFATVSQSKESKGGTT
jgi:hypothetical protein